MNPKKDVLVIDTRKEETDRKREAGSLQKFSQELRDSAITKYISRIVMSIRDPEAKSVCPIPQNDIRNCAVVEVYDAQNLELAEKYVRGFLVSKRYKILGSKTFKNKEYPVCKLIVKFA